MAFLFGGARPSSADSLKDYQRRVAASARGVQREGARLEGREAQIRRELDKLVKSDRIDEAKDKATELVRLRAHRDKLRRMGSHLQALSQQLQAVHSADKMQEILATTARILQGLNQRLDAVTVQRMLAEYERQNSLMANKSEVVDDALDSMFEVDGEEQATSETVALVLKEAGLDTMAKLGAGTARSGEFRESDQELAARLQALRAP